MKPIFALILLAACSHNPLDSGAGNDPGGGTNTLLVTGTVISSPRTTNATQPTDFNTEFDVHVSLNGAEVTTGTVNIKSNFVSVPLTYNGQNGNGNHWRGMAAGYDEVYQLDVTSGADSVTNVIVDGPDIHHITAPTAGATLDSTMMFAITWDRAAPADEARFAAGDQDGIVIPDSGTYSVAPGTLHADQQQARTNTLRITRTNHVTPKGAVTGSMLSVGIDNELDVVAAPCPSC